MPLTLPDPKTALVPIDLQRGITGMVSAQTIAPVLENAGAPAADMLALLTGRVGA